MSALTAQPSAARMPPDDGTACYMRERIGFYRAAQSANRSQEILQLGGELTTSLLTQFGQSGAGYGNAFQKLLLQNFTDAVQKLQTGVQQDEQRIREFQQAFDALYDCRRREAEQINADLQAGRISRSEAERRMQQTRELLNEDISVARATNSAIEARTDSFQVAAQRARQEAQAAPSGEERKRRLEQVEEVESSVQTNQNALQESVASVETASSMQTQKEGDPFQISERWRFFLLRPDLA